MSAASGPDIIENGLVLCLDAGNRESYPGSGTTWTSLIGGLNGALTNGPTFSSANGGSIVFDGGDDYVTVPSSIIQGGTQLTFSVWNNGGSSNKANFLVEFYNANSIRVLLVHLPWSDGIIYFNAGDGVNNGYDEISKFAGPDVLGWRQWVFVKDSTTNTMFIYRNGQLWQTGTNKTRPIVAASGTGKIGTANLGSIAQVQIYNRALTPAEVLQNYNATKSRFRV